MDDRKALTIEEMEAGKKAKREYMRKWRAEHKDYVREYQMRYWARKCKELQEAE